MRVRLRPAYSPGRLRQVYPRQYDHTKWLDHIERVVETIKFAQRLNPAPRSIADLSCGDGAIPMAIATWAHETHGDPVRLELGDLVGQREWQGPIERTLPQIPPVDLWVCSETVEHLDDPETVLTVGAGKAGTLLLTTPTGEIDDQNPEHYWGWDTAGVRELLESTGWAPFESQTWRPHVGALYTFQFWLARSVSEMDMVS